MNKPGEHIICPKCEGSYFLQTQLWDQNGERLAEHLEDNPLTLLCAHCGVCLQFIAGEWKWLIKETVEGAKDEKDTTDR